LKTYYENETLESNFNGETKTLVGVVGMVDINNTTLTNLLVSYQYYEYLLAQLQKRRCQSIITNKVNCLSGCNQLIRVCNETCGNTILDDFNRKPRPDENIFNQILSYASEDRNHICLMFKHYPWVRTVQSIDAISYTNVPNNFKSLLRQRKRWCLGAFSNDLLLITNKHHHLWERINASVNVLVFTLCPFIIVVTVEFMFSIINHPTFLMLQLASIMLVPIIYGALIPILIYKHITTIHKIYYYLGMFSFYSWGILLNLVIFIFSIWNIDDFQWNNQQIKNSTSGTPNTTELNSKHTTMILDTINTSPRHTHFNTYLKTYDGNDNNNNAMVDNSSVDNIRMDNETSNASIEDNSIILERHSLLSKISSAINYGVKKLRCNNKKTRILDLDEIDNFVYGVQLDEHLELYSSVV